MEEGMGKHNVIVVFVVEDVFLCGLLVLPGQ